MQHAADQNQKSVKKASSKPSSKSTTAADDQQVEPRGKHKADDGKSKQQQQQQQQQLEDKLGATEQSLGGQLGQGGGQGAGRRDADNHAKPQVGIQQTQQPATQHQRQPLGKPGKPVPRMQRLMAEAAQRKAEAQAAREAVSTRLARLFALQCAHAVSVICMTQVYVLCCLIAGIASKS
jgi:hypothetical protein